MSAKGQPRSPTHPAKIPVGLRIPQDKLDEITARADALKLSRTDYMILAAVGELPAGTKSELEERVDELERTVERLAKATFGG